MSVPRHIRDLPFSEIHPLIRNYTASDVFRVFTIDDEMPPVNELIRRLVKLQHIVVSVIAKKGRLKAEEEEAKAMDAEINERLAQNDREFHNAMKTWTDYHKQKATRQRDKEKREKARKKEQEKQQKPKVKVDDEGDDARRYSQAKLRRKQSESTQAMVFMLINTLLQICKRAPPVPFVMALTLLRSLSVEFKHPDRLHWSGIIHDVLLTEWRNWDTMGVVSKTVFGRFVMTWLLPNQAKNLITDQAFDALTGTNTLRESLEALVNLYSIPYPDPAQGTTVLHEDEPTGCYTYGMEKDQAIRQDFHFTIKKMDDWEEGEEEQEDEEESQQEDEVDVGQEERSVNESQEEVDVEEGESDESMASEGQEEADTEEEQDDENAARQGQQEDENKTKKKKRSVEFLILDGGQAVFDLSGPARYEIEMSEKPLAPWGPRHGQFNAPDRSMLKPITPPVPMDDEPRRHRDFELERTMPYNPVAAELAWREEIRRLVSKIVVDEEPQQAMVPIEREANQPEIPVGRDNNNQSRVTEEDEEESDQSYQSFVTVETIEDSDDAMEQ